MPLIPICQPFHMRFCNGVDENFQLDLVVNIGYYERTSQKLVSRIVLPYKSIYNNRDIFYDKMVLIFFMNTIAKPHVKRLCDTLELHKFVQHAIQ